MTGAQWRCPGCGIPLYVAIRGSSYVISRSGKVVTSCPNCGLRKLNTLYRLELKGER